MQKGWICVDGPRDLADSSPSLSGGARPMQASLSGGHAEAYWWTLTEDRARDGQRRNLARKSQGGHL
jgi:hypothetical protein